jgi:phosphoglucosamine mutase
MGKLFGTDGVRGIANKELTCELAFLIGQAAGYVLKETEHTHQSPTILIGKDTRISADMLEAALTAGLCSVGAQVVSLGVIPTPAVAFLVTDMGASAGIVISASHNPMEYNGIKIFNAQGFKLSDELEDEIETLVKTNCKDVPKALGAEIGKMRVARDAVDRYINHLVKSVEGDLAGLKIGVDCANGAASTTAPELFRRLGADCRFIHCDPNGVNINERCGSTHMEDLAALVKENGLDVGIAFDGDVDRMLAVDETGEIIDGDQLMVAMALDLKAWGKLKNNAVAVTVMSNLGLHKVFADYKIDVSVTDVGDRYVLERMLGRDLILGGEQSGHIIRSDLATTGDGQLAALIFLEILARSGNTASGVASAMTVYPQILVNAHVTDQGKKAYSQDPEIAQRIQEVTDAMAGDGRVLIRPSGTEPLVRVMLEGKDQGAITELAESVAEIIREKYGK